MTFYTGQKIGFTALLTRVKGKVKDGTVLTSPLTRVKVKCVNALLFL